MSTSSGPIPADPTLGLAPIVAGGETQNVAALHEVAAKAVDFAELSPKLSGAGAGPLERLLDVKVAVTVELGRATTTIGQVLEMGVGSVLELDRAVSEPVDLMAQGVRLARGEVVVVNDRFAIRIKEIAEPKKSS